MRPSILPALVYPHCGPLSIIILDVHVRVRMSPAGTCVQNVRGTLRDSDRVADLPGKVLHAERFMDKMHPFLQHAVMDNDV